MSTYLTKSLSESFHASIITQRHDPFKQNYDVTNRQAESTVRHEDHGERGSSSQTIPVCSQALLTLVFAGIEIPAAFSIIYNILFLEFLGVPTRFVSMGGVICGVTAFAMLPIIGWFSDRGSNTVIRKGSMMLIGYSCYAVGLLLLILCSAWKLYPDELPPPNPTTGNDYHGFLNFTNRNQIELERFWNATDNNPKTLTNQSSNFPTAFLGNTTIYSNKINDPNIASDENESPTSLSTIGVAGIIGFAVLDIGFDACTSLCRAFILECSPPSLHSRLLVMSTAFGAVSGCLLSFVGSFDIPGFLGPMLQVDGTAATVLILCVAIFITITSTFACTLITGFKISKTKYRIKEKVTNLVDDSESMYNDRKHLCKSQSRTSPKTQLSSEDLFQGSSVRQPLLSLDHSSKDYSALTKPVENLSTKNKSNMFSQRWTENGSKILHENKVLDKTVICDSCVGNDPDDNNSCNRNDNDFLISKSCSEHNSVENDAEEGLMNEEHNRKRFGISSLVSSIFTSYSVSTSIPPISHIGDNFQTQKNDGEFLYRKSATSEQRPLWKNKRLLILCLSMFFTMGAMLAYSAYGSNILTIGIYHGVPLGRVGTPGRDRYDKGLRQAALGNLVSFLTYMSVSVLNKKTIELIGEKAQYMVCQISLMVAFTVFLLVQTEALYFVTSAVCGSHRACALTLGYLMANNFVLEDNASRVDDTKNPPESNNVGQVMVMIGMTTPASYLLCSSLMGPLMSALNNPWVPMAYGAFCAAMSLISFCLLFLVKR